MSVFVPWPARAVCVMRIPYSLARVIRRDYIRVWNTRVRARGRGVARPGARPLCRWPQPHAQGPQNAHIRYKNSF